MNTRISIILMLVVIPTIAAPTQGQLFRKTPPRPDPNTKVPELLSIVKSDPDERKRAAAIEILRRVDAKANAEIVPVLIDVLLKDPKPNVRLEAVQSLARVRPPSAEVGRALEQAAEKDESRWVKTYARSAFAPHRIVTAHAKKAEEPGKATPTLTGPRISVSQPPTSPKAGDGPTTSALKPPSPVNADVPQPLPASPAWISAAPVPLGQPASPKATPVEGPVLAPPK